MRNLIHITFHSTHREVGAKPAEAMATSLIADLTQKDSTLKQRQKFTKRNLPRKLTPTSCVLVPIAMAREFGRTHVTSSSRANHYQPYHYLMFKKPAKRLVPSNLKVVILLSHVTFFLKFFSGFNSSTTLDWATFNSIDPPPPYQAASLSVSALRLNLDPIYRESSTF